MADIVVIICPCCERRYRFDTERFGRSGIRVRCRSCLNIMEVDAPASAGVLDGGARRKAMVAERDPVLRNLLEAVLRERSYEVRAVGDGLAARRLVEEWQPELAFINVFLPEVLGITLCVELKQGPSPAPRVVLVGSLYGRDRFIKDPHGVYGADDFLDGSGSERQIRHHMEDLLAALEAPDQGNLGDEDEMTALHRLMRIIADDIILYNGVSIEDPTATDHFFTAFADEIKEGEALVERRFPHVQKRAELLHEALRQALQEHWKMSRIPASVG